MIKNMTDYYVNDARSFSHIYEDMKSRTMLYFNELQAIHHYVINSNYIKGDLAEVGCHRGGTSYLIASASLLDKKVYSFDSFSGLQEAEECDKQKVSVKGLFTASFDECSKFLSRFGERSKIIKGYLDDTLLLPEIQNNRYSFVYIDVDLYHAALQAYEHFFPRIESGGWLLSHEYKFVSSPGVDLALQEYFGDLDNYECYVVANQIAIRKL